MISTYLVPIGGRFADTQIGWPIIVAPGATIQLKPDQLYDFNGKLYASDPTASRTMRYYKSMAELAQDYDSLMDGDQVYIYGEAIPGAVPGQSYAKGMTRGSITVVAAIIYATLIIIVAISTVAIISSLTTFTATIKKTPVTSTKPVGEGATAVTAPDGTVWLIDNKTGQVITQSIPAGKYVAIIAGSAIAIGGTYALIKYVLPWVKQKASKESS